MVFFFFLCRTLLTKMVHVKRVRSYKLGKCSLVFPSWRFMIHIIVKALRNFEVKNNCYIFLASHFPDICSLNPFLYGPT